jgi:hypothetical protein
MASLATSPSPLLYPKWQTQYEAALLETDRHKLPIRVAVAELVILNRLHVLVGTAGREQERQAMSDALRATKAARAAGEKSPRRSNYASASGLSWGRFSWVSADVADKRPTILAVCAPCGTGHLTGCVCGDGRWRRGGAAQKRFGDAIPRCATRGAKRGSAPSHLSILRWQAIYRSAKGTVCSKLHTQGSKPVRLIPSGFRCSGRDAPLG